MSLEQIASISQTIAAFSLVLSLVYAALQFGMYANATREARVVAAAAVFQDFSQLLASNADCARILRDGLNDIDELEPVERWRFGSLMQMLIANSQLVLELDNVGSQDHFHVQSMRRIMRTPGARQWWARERKMFAAPTVASVDAIMAAADTAMPEDRGSSVSEDAPAAPLA